MEKDVEKTLSISPQSLEAAAITLTELDHIDDWSYGDWESMDEWQKKSALDAAKAVLEAAQNAAPVH